MKRILIAVFCATTLVSAPALADVKITSTMGGKGMGQMMNGQVVTYIKGLKMRTEMTVMGRAMVTIMDVDAGKLINLDAAKKEATVSDLNKLSSDAQKMMSGAPKVSIKPNNQTRELLGKTCMGYDLSSSMTMNLGAMAPSNPNAAANGEMTLVMAGPLWVAKDAPGSADYARFHKAQAAKGLLTLNSPQGRPDGQAAMMSEMYKAMAEMNGIPYAMELAIKFQGSGPMAQMMSGMGDTSMTTAVTDVQTTPLADDLFAVPAGYATKSR